MVEKSGFERIFFLVTVLVRYRRDGVGSNDFVKCGVEVAVRDGCDCLSANRTTIIEWNHIQPVACDITSLTIAPLNTISLCASLCSNCASDFPFPFPSPASSCKSIPSTSHLRRMLSTKPSSNRTYSFHSSTSSFAARECRGVFPPSAHMRRPRWSILRALSMLWLLSSSCLAERM